MAFPGAKDQGCSGLAPLALQVVINWRPGPSAFTLVTSNGYDLIHLSAPVVPLDLWVSPGCRWEAGETDSVLKLPAFSRCIERRQPPFRPAGIQRCSSKLCGYGGRSIFHTRLLLWL